MVVVPALRNIETNIRLVLMVGCGELDRSIENSSAKIFNSHPRRLGGILSSIVSIDACLVIQNADFNYVIGYLCTSFKY